MSDKHCQKCKLYNPASAQRCDCGYDFDTQQMENTFLTEEQRAIKESASAGEIAVSLFIPIAGLVYGIVLITKGKKRGGQIMAASLIAMVILAIVRVL